MDQNMNHASITSLIRHAPWCTPYLLHVTLREEGDDEKLPEEEEEVLLDIASNLL